MNYQIASDANENSKLLIINIMLSRHGKHFSFFAHASFISAKILNLKKLPKRFKIIKLKCTLEDFFINWQ